MTHQDQNLTAEELEQIVEAHMGTSVDTPLRSDAFELSDGEKITFCRGYDDVMFTVGELMKQRIAAL